MWKKFFGQLQRIGKALMLPVAILPAAGLLLAFGTVLQGDVLQSYLPFIKANGFQHVAQMMEGAGVVIFDNLPMIFALGVAIGLASGDGVAAIAAFVGFMIMNKTMGAFLGITSDNVSDAASGYANVLGIPTLQTGVFGGIIIGALAAWCYNKFYNISLPSYLGFFAGKRFVPIMMATFSFILAFPMAWIWPTIQYGLNAFSEGLLESNTGIAVFLFGFIKRLLIPFGLHHIFHAPFWFEFGSFKNAAGQIIHGDQRIFIAQITENVPLTAGKFMGGEFPVMMFGLPAAALAIYHSAKKENRKVVGGLMLSGALTSFLTGITEPLEFSFLFVAPLLFFIHAVLDGFGFLIMYLLNVHLGYTFSGGFIDFLLLNILPKGQLQNTTSTLNGLQSTVSTLSSTVSSLTTQVAQISRMHEERLSRMQDEFVRAQEEMASHIRNLENNYQNVLNEMVLFQRNMAQQDGLMQNLIQYFLQVENGGFASSSSQSSSSSASASASAAQGSVGAGGGGAGAGGVGSGNGGVIVLGGNAAQSVPSVGLENEKLGLTLAAVNAAARGAGLATPDSNVGLSLPSPPLL